MDTASIPKIKRVSKKIAYKLPVIGKLLKSRNTIETERDNLLILLKNSNEANKPYDFKKISKKYSKNISGLKKFLSGKKNIFDIGTGPIGSPWWQEVDVDTKISGIDLYFFPQKVPKNVKIYKYDASKLDQIKPKDILERYVSNDKFVPEKVTLHHQHDLVVANHVLEHVADPERLIKGISNLISKNGIVYTGFPDYRNFTDVFYHLIHPDGGGHIQQLTNKSVQKMFEKHGFKMLECNIWPDGWGWLQHQYKPQNFGVKYINQFQIDYLCDVFRKELTPDKGYFYGWELVFKKL